MEQKKREQLLQIDVLRRQEQDLEKKEEGLQKEAEKVETDLALLRQIEHERNLSYQQQLMHLQHSIGEKTRRLEEMEAAKQQIGIKKRDVAKLEEDKPEQEYKLRSLQQQLRDLEHNEQNARLESERRIQDISRVNQHLKQRETEHLELDRRQQIETNVVERKKSPFKVEKDVSEKEGKFCGLQEGPDVLEQKERKATLDTERQTEDNINLHRQQQSESSTETQKRINNKSSSLQLAIRNKPVSPDRKRQRDLDPVDRSIVAGVLHDDTVEPVTKTARMSEALVPFQGGHVWNNDTFSVHVEHMLETLAPFMGRHPPAKGDDCSSEEVD